MVKSASMKLWQKLGVISISTSLCLLVLVVTTGKFARPQAPAKPSTLWNSRAIESTFAGVRVREIDPANSAVTFLYDIDNRTDTDFQLTKGPTLVMTRLKSSGSLSSEKEVTLNSSAFVPAKNRTRIELEMTRPFGWPSRMDAASQDRIRQLVTGEVADIEGFVLFDETARYQIDLPGGWAEVQPTPEAPQHN
jgi:hypothetical protein